MTDEELLEAYTDGYWEKAPQVERSDRDPHIAGLREVQKRARVVPEDGLRMWLVKFEGKPQAAYSRKVQAEVYASGFSHPELIEVIEGDFRSLPQGER